MSNGSRHGLYLVPETAYGTTPATPAFDFYRHNTTTLAAVKNTLQSEEIRPNRQLADFRMGTQQGAGNVVSELAFGSFDKVIEALMLGTWDSDTVRIGTTRRSFSILRVFDDLDGVAPNNKKCQLFTGMEANTLSLAVTTEAINQITVGWVGKGMSLSATPPVGATLGTPDDTAGMDSFTGTITEGGQSIAVITEIQINLENGIEPRYVVGSRNSIRPSLGVAQVSGQVTAYFEDSYLLEKYINEQTSNIEFTLTDGEGGNAYKFTLPKIKYTGGNTDVGGQGSITIVLPFTATYDGTSDTTMMITRIPDA